jgi:hypothetical protein
MSNDSENDKSASIYLEIQIDVLNVMIRLKASKVSRYLILTSFVVLGALVVTTVSMSGGVAGNLTIAAIAMMLSSISNSSFIKAFISVLKTRFLDSSQSAENIRAGSNLESLL